MAGEAGARRVHDLLPPGVEVFLADLGHERDSADTSAGLEGSREIFAAYVAAGGTTFDVSNIYQGGEAETVFGELLGRQRDDFVVITKYGGTRETRPRPATTGNSRKTVVRSLEDSLRRLNTDDVDVPMPHFPDGITPVAEILAGFDDLIRARRWPRRGPQPGRPPRPGCLRLRSECR